MPERIAAITGLRGTFRMTGGMIVVAVIVLYANGRSAHAVGLTKVYTLLAVLTVAVIFMAFAVPDTARQGRLQDQALPQRRAKVYGGPIVSDDDGINQEEVSRCTDQSSTDPSQSTSRS